jgi:PGF-pre-PGF domain-containing protein
MKVLALIAACLLLFTAAYAAGDTITGRVSIAAPPVITINIPILNAWYHSTFIVNASISGTAHATTYQWINSSTNGPYVPMTNISNGIWTANFNTSLLADGNYTLLVNASNRFNMTGNKTVDFHVDNTAPVISSFVLTKTDTIYAGSPLTASDFSCSATDNSESSGGSVTIIITGLSTATAGIKTATCTATDLAGNTDTETVQYTVVSTGGGGAGRGAGGAINGTNQTNETTETVILEQLPAGQTVHLTNFVAPIVSIDIEAAQTITNSDIQVSIIQSAQSVPKAKVFIYFEIKSSIPEDAIKSVRITFNVDKNWLIQNNLSPDSVVLYGLIGKSWRTLDTNRVNETGSMYTYTATTSRFSTFAIAAGAPVLLNAVTGAAISIPTIPLSTNTVVLGIMALVLIAAIVISRMRSAKGKSRRR